MKEKRNMCLLGSTGSIGTQTLDIVRRHGGFNIVSLAAGSNISLLESQIREFRPKKVCVYDKEKALELKQNVADCSVEVLSGMDGLIEIAGAEDHELTVNAIVGMIGIRPTIAAIEAGSDIALANKETLVTAGHIIMPLVSEKHVRLLPIDSEHSAIFQCLQGHNGMNGYYGTEDFSSEIGKLLLTASGGPFRGLSYEELKTKTAEDALKHPNWSMGRKITVDSASMVNKALEVMEARWLFNVMPENICVVIQPKSIIHSAVQFIDGSIIAQLGVPDMRIPIQYALYYPDRMDSPAKSLDLFEVGQIDLLRPDYETFRGLKLGLDAITLGGSICTVFNAANEYAVARFLEGKVTFTGIYDIIEACMRRHKNTASPDLSEILDTERETYEYAATII